MPVFEIDEVTRTSVLKLYLSGVPFTQFSYANGSVTLAERLQSVTLTVADAGRQLETLGQWAAMVSDQLSPASGAVGEFMSEVKKANNKTEGDYKIGGVKVTDASYVWGSGNIKYEARPEHTMSWSGFLRWLTWMKSYHRDCAGG